MPSKQIHRKIIIFVIVIVVCVLALGGYTIYKRLRAIDIRNGGETQSGKYFTILRRSIPGAVKAAMDVFCDQPDVCDFTNLPDSFDCRKKWPAKITRSLNQKKCGSCWAFALTTALSDRIRIHSKVGENKIKFAGNKWKEEVLVRTNDTPLMNEIHYEDDIILDSLSPYTFAGCGICELAEKMDPIIRTYFTKENICNLCCDGGVIQYACIYAFAEGTISISKDPDPFDYTCTNYTGAPIYRAKTIYNLVDIDMIKANIYFKGPVIAGFLVMDTFDKEKGKIPGTDIYTEVGSEVGGHAISIMGWGKMKDDSGVFIDYWLCRNSWGHHWHTDGYFKIKMGSCGIEEDVWGLDPFDVYSLKPLKKIPLTAAGKKTCEKESSGVVNPK